MTNSKPKKAATYQYRNAGGRILYVKEKHEPGRDGKDKEFFFKHKKNGKRINGRGGDAVLYNLSDVIKTKVVFFVEGEGKVELLRAWGIQATCLDAGANSQWKSEYNKYIDGKDEIFILPDNDEPGRAYASMIANAVHDKVGVVTVIALPGLEDKGDIIDWEQLPGNDKEKLMNIIKETPVWIQSQGTDEDLMIKNTATDANEWQDPIPFDDYSKLPEFPIEALPEIGRKMVETVAKVNQVDKGLPGSMYLAALSTCLSKKVQVDLGTHTEPVNIYTCPILDPGERKTSTMNLMMDPIYEYQKDRAGAVVDDDEEPPVYVVDDITSEALFKLMSENGERMSVISAEGGIFGIMAGMYNAKGNGNIDVYLKGHAGDPCSDHRISRKSQSMSSPALTICLAVQRDIIRDIGKNKQFRGRGLIGRFLFCYCQHRAGYRKRQKEKVPETLKQEYRKHITKLMSMPLSLHNLELTPEAHAAWDEFHDDIEAQMQPGKPMESMKDWGSKLAGAVARIAGQLHYAEHGIQATNKPISVNVVNASAAIGAYYLAHALATFGLMNENPEIESAKRILEYLIHHKPDRFTGRDVLRHKHALKKMEEVAPGLKLLIERGYIKAIEDVKAGTFEVNPIIKTL
jgi:putative DNA primase/helicase